MVKIMQVRGQVSYGDAIKDFIKGSFDFRGRTTRAGFWYVILTMFPVLLYAQGALLLFFEAALSGKTNILSVVVLTFSFLLIIPLASNMVRRYRDAGITGKGALLLFIVRNIIALFPNSNVASFVGAMLQVFFLVLPFVPSDMLTMKTANRFLRLLFREKVPE